MAESKPRLIVYDIKGTKYNQVKYLSRVTPNAIKLLERAYAKKMNKEHFWNYEDSDVVVVNIITLDGDHN